MAAAAATEIFQEILERAVNFFRGAFFFAGGK